MYSGKVCAPLELKPMLMYSSDASCGCWSTGARKILPMNCLTTAIPPQLVDQRELEPNSTVYALQALRLQL